MRRTFIPDELESQIESLRGDTPFETWLALAITEKAWGSRFMPDVYATGGEPAAPTEELWVAIVEADRESILLWRYTTTIGVQLLPVFVFEEDHMEQWEERFAAELNFMDGPPISWRHFEGGEFVRWLRAPAPEDPD